MRSIAWRYSSMLKMPKRTASEYSALTRFSHGAWNTCALRACRTAPKPCLPPRSCMPSIAVSLQTRNADHRLLGHDRGELLLAPALGMRWPQRQHHVARVGGGVPDADLDFGLQVEPHFLQH